MRTKAVCRGTLSVGKVTMLSPKSVMQQLSMLPDGDVEVTFRCLGNKRSNPQNRYYWGVVVEYLKNFINENSGDTVVDDQFVHEMLIKKFLGTDKVVMPNSQVAERLKSTATLDKFEFTEYLEKIWAWALEVFSLDIPRPDD